MKNWMLGTSIVVNLLLCATLFYLVQYSKKATDHSITEFRFITVGISRSGQVLMVAHTDRGDTIRIISARKTTRQERKYYEEGE